jgi:hypothetical protein
VLGADRRSLAERTQSCPREHSKVLLVCIWRDGDDLDTDRGADRQLSRRG